MGETWREISDAPAEPVMVEVFFGNLILRDQHNKVCPPIHGVRDFRRGLGFWDGEAFCELNTGHQYVEIWSDPLEGPTHWRALPPPPLARPTQKDR